MGCGEVCPLVWPGSQLAVWRKLSVCTPQLWLALSQGRGIDTPEGKIQTSSSKVSTLFRASGTTESLPSSCDLPETLPAQNLPWPPPLPHFQASARPLLDSILPKPEPDTQAPASGVLSHLSLSTGPSSSADTSLSALGCPHSQALLSPAPLSFPLSCMQWVWFGKGTYLRSSDKLGRAPEFQ